jgi:uncharacterized protein YijF (DUF1287 family)
MRTLPSILVVFTLLSPARLFADEAAVTRAVARARREVSRRVAYDASYHMLTFKDEVDTKKALTSFGDVDPAVGVCTDVVVRALRVVGIDLQSRVHMDILASPGSYPDIKVADANIDHRRVRPLLEFFDRYAKRLDADPKSPTWKAGDLVIWSFTRCPNCVPSHVGMISDRPGTRGMPLVIHNIGPRPAEDDVLDAFVILRHYRVIDVLK